MVKRNERLVHRIKELEDRHTATLERVVYEAERTAELETRSKELNARLDNQTDCRCDSDQDGTSLRAARSHSDSLRVETRLHVAVQHIQATFCPQVMAADSYEMVWVMEYLRDNPMSAVIYYASNWETR